MDREQMIILSEKDRYTDVFLVYYCKGNILVKKGNMKMNGCFIAHGETYRHCGLSQGNHIAKPLELCCGKVWCHKEEDVPKAINIIMERRQQYIEETKERAAKAAGQFVGVKNGKRT